MKQSLKLYKDLFDKYINSIKETKEYVYDDLMMLIKLKKLWEDADISKDIEYYNQIKDIEDKLLKLLKKNDIFEKYRKQGEIYRNLLIQKELREHS